MLPRTRVCADPSRPGPGAAHVGALPPSWFADRGDVTAAAGEGSVHSTIISTPKSSRNGDTGHEGPRGALLDERGGNGRADRPRNSVQHAALEPETSRVLQPHTRCPRRNDVDIFQQDMWEIATATETAMKRNPPVYHGFSKTGKKRKIGESVPKPRQCCHVPVGSPSAGSSLGKVIRRACP